MHETTQELRDQLTVAARNRADAQDIYSDHRLTGLERQVARAQLVKASNDVKMLRAMLDT